MEKLAQKPLEARIKPPKVRPKTRKMRQPPVHHDSESNWLVSYADLMTLMFGFFVLVAAFSTPDAEKIEKLKKATVEYLDAPYVEPNRGLAESLMQVLRDFQLEDEIKLISTEEGLSLTSRGTLFFDTASVELKPQARELLEKVADVLVDKAKNFKIFVEGHTDDVPIHNLHFPSNWELSSGRASTVVRLLETRGFPHSLLRPLGLADVEPTMPNYVHGQPSEDNRAHNRRIVIRLQEDLPRRMPPAGAYAESKKGRTQDFKDFAGRGTSSIKKEKEKPKEKEVEEYDPERLDPR